MTADPRLALDRTILLLQDYVAADDTAILDTLTGLRVRLHADAAVLASGAGRAALIATFDTVARLGVELELDLPGATIALPPGYPQGPITSALRTRGDHLITPVADRSAARPADLTITLADAAADLSIGGSSTTARLAVGRAAGSWQGELPFGGSLGACLAGAEVARRVLATLLERHQARVPIRVEAQAAALALPPLYLPAQLELGRVDFISAGAVTQGLLLQLFQIEGLALDGRVFDDDIAHADNLNRYYLLTTEWLEHPKVKQLEQLSLPDIRIRGNQERVTLERSREIGALAETVCIGADSVEARWDVQRLASGWLGVGATSHAHAVASEHVPEQACAACLHPQTEELNERLPTIAFVSLWAGTVLAYRLVRALTDPQHRSECTEMLDAFNLSSSDAVLTQTLRVNSDCRLGHDESGRAS